MLLEARNVSFSYGNDAGVLKNFSLLLKEKNLTMLLGRNGCGKSTALKLLSGLLAPKSGTVLLDGRPVRSYSGRERSKRLAYLPQGMTYEPELSVRTLVMAVRCASSKRLFGIAAKEDEDAVETALALMRVKNFSDRLFPTLSGGEKQKVLLAAALAQEPEILLLDEPVSASDPAGTLDTLSLLLDLKKRLTILMVTHDAALAARFADDVILMNDGTVCASGTPESVLTDENASKVYGCGMERLPLPDGKFVPYLTPPRSETAEK